MSSMWLLSACPRLAGVWQWAEIVSLMTSQCAEVRFLVIHSALRVDKSHINLVLGNFFPVVGARIKKLA